MGNVFASCCGPSSADSPQRLGGAPPTERDRAAQTRAAEQAEARQRAFEASAVGRAAMRAVREAKGEGAAAGGGRAGGGGGAATNSGPTAQDWLN